MDVLLVLLSVQLGVVIVRIILKDHIATQDTLAEFIRWFRTFAMITLRFKPS